MRSLFELRDDLISRPISRRRNDFTPEAVIIRGDLMTLDWIQLEMILRKIEVDWKVSSESRTFPVDFRSLSAFEFFILNFHLAYSHKWSFSFTLTRSFRFLSLFTAEESATKRKVRSNIRILFIQYFSMKKSFVDIEETYNIWLLRCEETIGPWWRVCMRFFTAGFVKMNGMELMINKDSKRCKSDTRVLVALFVNFCSLFNGKSNAKQK